MTRRGFMSAGYLRDRVKLQSRTITDDGSGGETVVWTTGEVSLWARVSDISAREAMMQGQLQGAVTHRVILRTRSGITTAQRILWGSRVLLIQGVRVPDEDRRMVELLCVEERV